MSEYNETKFIILLLGLFFRILGPLSQNTVYSSDDIIQVGIIESLRIGHNIENTTLTYYPLLLFQRIIGFFAELTSLSSHDALLIFSPILFFLLYTPFIINVSKILPDKQKLIFFGIFYFGFPIAQAQRFALTPYGMLIALFALILGLYPYDKKWKIFLIFIATISSVFTHIHGFLVIPMVLLLFSISRTQNENWKLKLLFIISFITFVPLILILILFNYLNNSILDLINNSTIITILARIGNQYGELQVVFVPKFLEGGVFSLWYLGQLAFFLIIFACSLYQLIFHWKSVKNAIEKTYYENLIQMLSILSIFISLLCFWSLFYSYNTQMWRYYYFLVLTGPLVVIDTTEMLLYKVEQQYSGKYDLNKVFKKISPLSCFLLIFSFQFSSYYQYTVYQQYEYEGVEWVADNLLISGEEPWILAGSSMTKLIYGLTLYENRIYWHDFWVNTWNNTQEEFVFNPIFNGKTFNYVIWTISDAVSLIQFQKINISQIIIDWETQGFLNCIYFSKEFRVYNINIDESISKII